MTKAPTNGIHPSHTTPPRPVPAEHRRRHVLRCLNTSVVAAALLIAVGAHANAQQLLTADDIKSQIIGHSFQGRKGIMSVTLHYGQDGTVTMRTPLGSGVGDWMLSDNQLCVTLLSGPRKGKECLTFISQSDGSYRASNGLRLELTE